MPFGDGTGPRGMGPMTGRGLGSCSSPRGSVFRGVPAPGLGRAPRSWLASFPRWPRLGARRGLVRRGRGLGRRW